MIVRTQSLAGNYVHVDEEDPALDKAEESWRQRYDRAIEVSDLAGLPIKDGEKPTVWKFRHLTSDEAAWLADVPARGGGSVTMCLDALALALVGIDGAKDENGRPFTVPRARDPERRGFTAVKKTALDAILRTEDGRINMSLAKRLGDRVLLENFPPNG